MGGVEVPQAPMGNGEWTLPTRGMVWGGGNSPSPEIFLQFLLKIPYFDAF